MAQIFKLAKGALDRLFSVFSRKYGYEQQVPRRRYANPKELYSGNSSAVKIFPFSGHDGSIIRANTKCEPRAMPAHELFTSAG